MSTPTKVGKRPKRNSHAPIAFFPTQVQNDSTWEGEAYIDLRCMPQGRIVVSGDDDPTLIRAFYGLGLQISYQGERNE